ncbi:MAG: NUDIX hydrolase [Balneolaceae bacterium]
MCSRLNRDRRELVEQELSSESIYQGELLRVYKDRVRLPDGEESTREWIRHPGACAIVPVFPDGTIQLVRQYRYPVRQLFLEVPAGKIDPGEPPEKTARRETLEETGWKPASIAYAGHFYPVIGYSDEIIHTWVAWDLEKAETGMDDDEFLEPEILHFREAIRGVADGTITDGKTICALQQAANWWRSNGPFSIHF